MRLFLNPERNAYLRELADEFHASPSHIKEELDQLREANLLTSKKNGRQVLFSANQKHPVFNELHSMVKKALGMDCILESMLKRLGNLELKFPDYFFDRKGFVLYLAENSLLFCGNDFIPRGRINRVFAI